MPKQKPENRIASLRAFIAEQEDRLANHRVIQTIRAKIEGAKKTVEALEVSEAKRRKEEEVAAVKVAADQKRKDDQRAKILMGAGLDLLPSSEEVARIRANILPVLNQRDREWWTSYAERYGIALSPVDATQPSPRGEDERTSAPITLNPVGSALLRAINKLDPMMLSHIGGELLTTLDGADRSALEHHLATLERRSLNQASPKD